MCSEKSISPVVILESGQWLAKYRLRERNSAEARADTYRSLKRGVHEGYQISAVCGASGLRTGKRRRDKLCKQAPLCLSCSCHIAERLWVTAEDEEQSAYLVVGCWASVSKEFSTSIVLPVSPASKIQ